MSQSALPLREAEWAVCPTVAGVRLSTDGQPWAPQLFHNAHEAEAFYSSQGSGWLRPVGIRRLRQFSGQQSRLSVRDFEPIKIVCLQQSARLTHEAPLEEQIGEILSPAVIEDYRADEFLDAVVDEIHHAWKPKPPQIAEQQIACYLSSDWRFAELEVTAGTMAGVAHGEQLLEYLSGLEGRLREMHPSIPAAAEVEFWRSWQVWNRISRLCAGGAPKARQLWDEVSQQLPEYVQALIHQQHLARSGKEKAVLPSRKRIEDGIFFGRGGEQELLACVAAAERLAKQFFALPKRAEHPKHQPEIDIRTAEEEKRVQVRVSEFVRHYADTLLRLHHPLQDLFETTLAAFGTALAQIDRHAPGFRRTIEDELRVHIRDKSRSIVDTSVQANLCRNDRIAALAHDHSVDWVRDLRGFAEVLDKSGVVLPRGSEYEKWGEIALRSPERFRGTVGIAIRRSRKSKAGRNQKRDK